MINCWHPCILFNTSKYMFAHVINFIFVVVFWLVLAGAYFFCQMRKLEFRELTDCTRIVPYAWKANTATVLVQVPQAVLYRTLTATVRSEVLQTPGDFSRTFSDSTVVWTGKLQPSHSLCSAGLLRSQQLPTDSRSWELAFQSLVGPLRALFPVQVHGPCSIPALCNP